MIDLEDIMKYENFCVVGNTLDSEKYAYLIKEKLLEHNYQVSCVGYELKSLNDVSNLEVVDLCIHPAKGIKLLEECNQNIKCVLIQPGAQSNEIINFLSSKQIPFLEGCALVGLKLFKK